MSGRTAELHADWLRLVEPEGRFLSLPVLRQAFPTGLDAVLALVREALPDQYPQVRRGAAPEQVLWDGWIDWLMRDALAWGSCYRTADDAALFAHAVPEHGIVLRANGALVDPQTEKPRVLLVRYPHDTALDHRLNGDHWNASPIDRLMLLCRAQSVRIGLLTDGERLLLAWIPAQGAGGYATWDTSLFTESRERNLLQSFISLLHASRFFSTRQEMQLEALFELSERAESDVTDQLGFQVRQAVELLVAALSRANLELGGALLTGIAPQRVYEAAVTVMMRLVFLLYAEERDLLPLSQALYADGYAASTLRAQLDDQAAIEGDEPLERRSAAWYRLLALFRGVYVGFSHDLLRMPPYAGRLFDPDRFPFLEGRSAKERWSDTPSRPLPIDDLTVRAILEALQTLPIRENGAKERRRLSFRALDVEQIGHVYEGLLDHSAVRVDDVYVGLVGKTGDEAELPLSDLEQRASQGSQPLVSFLHDCTGKSENAVVQMIERGYAIAAGRDPDASRLVNTICDNDAALARRVAPFYYALRKDLHGLPVVFPQQSLVVKKTRERRSSGTEYTPRALAEEMVRYALEPLVYSPGPKEGVEPEQWRLRPSSELLSLKICDPAVGSGAFLVSACRYLADCVVEAWLAEDPKRANIDREELTLDARRAVVVRCLYGVDRDPMAVEMAKLSLWLVTMAHERPFSFLDHAIREGDSLLGISSLDQIKYLHIDPKAGRAAHKRMLINALALVQPIVEQAAAIRRNLELLPCITVRDSQEKLRLTEQAYHLLERIRIVADGVVATALVTADQGEGKRDVAFQGLAVLVAAALDESQPEEKRLEALDRLSVRNEQDLNAGRPANAPPRTAFHWPLAFPEVFEHGGFDVMVGNPPFVGGQKITGAFGTDYRTHLVWNIGGGRRGSGDLVAYFFLRAAVLATNFAFLAVNTIAQGDTREIGIDALVHDGWTITRGVRSRVWPGVAGIHIAQLWLSRTISAMKANLDGVEVAGITPLLSKKRRTVGHPYRLAANSGVAFQGSIVLGLGFTMEPEEARSLIDRDVRNGDVLFPYLNAEDLCSRPDGSPSRWVINFFDWPIERVECYREIFEIIVNNVKAERQRRKNDGQYQLRNPLPQKWWQYAEKRPALYRTISNLDRVIVMPRVSKVVLPMVYPTGIVFSDRLEVIASESYTMFGLLSSTLHRVWARRYSSTLETRTNYSPSDCFDTFPFPTEETTVRDVGQHLNLHREKVMPEMHIGLTVLYNRMHNNSNNDAEVIHLRKIHAELDVAVCSAYGWSDLNLDYGFHQTDEGVRWTIGEESRDEILDRLLELNHQRHQEEVEKGRVLADGSKPNGKQHRSKSPAANGAQLSMGERA